MGINEIHIESQEATFKKWKQMVPSSNRLKEQIFPELINYINNIDIKLLYLSKSV